MANFIRMKVSVVISAFNEENKIEDCLRSVSWADEIVFVDNESTDNTVKIARKYTKKIYRQPNREMLNINKNYGFTKASYDWILNLDADEKAEKELENEIVNLLNQPLTKDGKEISGFYIPRKNIIFNKWIKHTGWYPDYQLRLFKKDAGKFPCRHVHEKIEIDGQTDKLKNHLIHRNYEIVSQFLKKMDLYTDNEAENLLKDYRQEDVLDIINLSKKEFLNRYFAGSGYKDNMHGLVLSLLMSFYYFITYAKLWEKGHFKETPFSLDDFEKNFDITRKEIDHWIKKTKFRNNHSLINKLKLKYFN